MPSIGIAAAAKLNLNLVALTINEKVHPLYLYTFLYSNDVIILPPYCVTFHASLSTIETLMLKSAMWSPIGTISLADVCAADEIRELIEKCISNQAQFHTVDPNEDI